MGNAISVIVPIFNAEKWLLRCVNRILNQPFRDIEVLLVNDGSTDRSGAICDELALVDARIKVIHKSNSGTSNTKNVGIMASSGKYIAFLDADDEIDELFFVKLYATAEEHDCEVVISGYETVPTGLRISPQYRLHSLLNGKDLILSAAAVHSDNDLCFAWRSLFLRESLERNVVKFHEGLTIGEDTIFHLEALLAAERAYALPDTLYFYTVNNLDSLMSSPYKPYLEKSLILQYELRKRISEEFGLYAHSHFKRDMAAYHIGSILSMLIRNFKNSPMPVTKADLIRILNLEMITNSTSVLGYRYKCSSLKEYLYYLSIKFKLAAVLYNWEFNTPLITSLLPFRITEKSKPVNDRTIR
ncbi:glycosyltransferase family 2 protein [Paenibacillus sp. PL91]|uniref:glycosyltransferase family 2 protein n=1 Tax=Paenibacillus sp. PL91 TaxID=2729538 RepID=UPI00145CF249|nr:glycosyltransferase family 2 protein [Paenibacillus sp. PL91]MBC9202120.1 glycosyltransferase family 2 protein [Paenibacillus sp. PL91]